ncbi:MAG: HEAT repeat domain-containing protein [Candidatus Zixiibacteriota bacterium]
MSKILNIFFLLILALPVFSEEPPKDSIEKRVDSLFIIASSGELKYRDMVIPAQDSLVAMGVAAVPRLVGKIDTQVARESHAVSDILVRIGKPATAYLADLLRSDDPEISGRACYALGKIKDSSVVDAILETARHSDWRIRANAIGALGDIGDNRADNTIIEAFKDTNENVRKAAAVAAARLKISSAAPELTGMLGDDFYGARMCASEALIEFGPAVIGIIADSLASKNELVGNLGCSTLGMIGGDSAAVILTEQLSSKSPLRRVFAVEGILNSNSSMACGAVELLHKSEKDPIVLFYIEKVLEKYASE